MAAKEKLSSPMLGPINNIVKINRSRSAMRSTQTSFNSFLGFMEIETKKIRAVKLPSEKKIKNLQSLNVASTFGRPGSLLSSLFSGALDLGGFLGEMFGGRGKPSTKAGKPIPKGKGIRLGGIKALGLANAAFAGLDFATGLAEGESVGKAASGAGGALAGSLLGGAIGQALIPIPGLGFVVGSMAGNFLGGYLGDRAYETVTGEKSLKEETEQRLREQTQKQREKSFSSGTNFQGVLNKFEQVVVNFEAVFAKSGSMSVESVDSTTGETVSQTHTQIKPRKGGGTGPDDPQNNTYSVTGGELPSSYVNTVDYGEFRQYYNEGKGGNHKGEDLPVPQGTPVSLVVPGTVRESGFSADAAGGNILITHEDGTETRYLHMSAIHVKPGDKVASGQVIGLTGGAPGTKGAGRSTGPHLHFEFYKNTTGPPTDPGPAMDKYFRFGGNIKVKKKEGPKEGEPSSEVSAKPSKPEKLMSENEFHVARTDSDVSDKHDVRIGNSQTYKEYLKYYEQNKGKFSEDLTENIEAVASDQTINPIEKPKLELQKIDSNISKQIARYNSYDSPRGRIVVVPIIQQLSGNGPVSIMAGGGGGGNQGGGMPSPGSMLNNVVKNIFLTTLTGT